MNRLLVTDPDVYEDMIRERKRLGHDHYDEVWEGVYVMPSMPALGHQDLVGDLTMVFKIVLAGRARVHPGANVSDRKDWKDNFRVPDVVVVFPDSRAVDCGTFWLGGPDFLVEIQSPGDETDAKIPFYSQIQVEELLVVERDSRKLRLLRHDGKNLVEMGSSSYQSGKWLVSKVLPLAFRRKLVKGDAKIEIVRTDGQDARWLV
jgi:Uma2 family endonuclease